MDQSRIRNFSIIAHIDHGKSTLADRILEITRRGDRARDARPAARLDGPRARARHHHQGAGRARAVAARRRDVPPQPDRHARARRLHVRGVALAGRLRGRAAGGRRRAGRRGADASPTRYLAIDNNLEIIPVRQQDRPAGRRPGRRRGGDRRPARRQARRRACASRPRAGSASARCWRRCASASRRPRATPTAPPRALIIDSVYDQYRGVIAFVRVVDGAFRRGAGDPLDGHRRALRGRGDRRLRAGHGAHRRAAARARSATSSPASRTSARSASATPSRTTTGRAAEPLPGYQDVKPMVFAGLFPTDGERLRRPARRAGQAEAQRRLAASTSRRPARRSASASAAASWACCTWRSSRSGWSASSTSTCWPPRRTSRTR